MVNNCYIVQLTCKALYGFVMVICGVVLVLLATSVIHKSLQYKHVCNVCCVTIVFAWLHQYYRDYNLTPISNQYRTLTKQLTMC